MIDSPTKPPRMLGLGHRLALLVGLALCAGIGLVASVAISRSASALRAQFLTGAERTTDLLSQTLGGAVRFAKTDIIAGGLESFRTGQESAIAWMAVVDAAGAPLVVKPLLSEPGPGDLAEASAGLFDAGAIFRQGLVTGAPIRFGPENPVVGGVVIGWSDTDVAAAAAAETTMLGGIGIALALVMATAAYLVLSRVVSRPIAQLDGILGELAAGDYRRTVPGAARRDEIGTMARNLETLRGALAAAREQQAHLAEIEHRAQAGRTAMLAALRSGVGRVVLAVQRGDFSQKVAETFDDETMQTLADGVDAICDTVARFLDDSEKTVTALSRGNLGQAMSAGYSGRFAEVAEALNATLDRLKDLVAELQSTESGISATVTEIGRDADDLASRTIVQAAAVQQTSATMVELSTTIETNADNARASAEAVGDAQGQADASRLIISQAVAAMQEIQRSTQQITEIINAIDGFAFQTNLLSLNAAVEAARAGDAGKGFAVVASEVRTLAQRAADAAKDIRNLISVSQANVKDGARIVDQTGAALSEILNSFVAIAPAMSHISQATREQSLGVNELTSTLTQIDETTQQNVHLAEKGAEQAQTLREQAESLSRLIAFFQPDDEHGVRPYSHAAE